MLSSAVLIFFSLFCALTRAQSTPDQARLCSPDKYDTGIECQYCPPGAFSLSEQSFTCGDCPRGYGVQLSDSICLPCEPGTYSLQPGAEPCDNCFPGYYSDEYGAVECKKCPDGTFSSGGGAHALESCIVCPPGSRWAFIMDNVADCIPCEPGTTSTEPNSEKCTACPPGTFQPFGDAYEDLNARICLPCPVGTFNDKNGTWSCTPCPSGSYQHGVGATSCKKCPPGAESDPLGSTQCLATCEIEDDSCISCPVAWGLDTESAENSSCSRCPAGMVNNRPSVTECVECDTAAGQISNENQTKCACAAGLLSATDDRGYLTCERCPDGASSPDGLKCLCTGGRYMHPAGFCDCKAGAKFVSGECVPCAEDELLAVQDDAQGYEEGEEYHGEGDDYEEEDYEDEMVYIEGLTMNECALCGPGYGLSASGICCVPCANGTAMEFVNLSECKACPGEQVPNEDGSECMCPPGTARTETGCAECPAGTFSDGPQAVCAECWPGTFSGPGSSGCTPCPHGTESVKGASECMPLCPEFSERMEDGSCRCVESAVQVGRNPVKCEECPGIQLANEARTECMCSPGYGLGEDGECRLCAPGSSGLGGDKACSLCEVGTASEIAGQAYSCHPCHSDEEATREGLTKCQRLCEEGSFRGSDGVCTTCGNGERVVNRKCVSCVDGTVSSGGAQAFCERCAEGLVPDAERGRCVRVDGEAPCAAGSWADKGGECAPCGAGSFSEVEDAGECSRCPKGTFQEEEGGKECVKCPKGFVAADEGSTRCTMCSENTFQDREGQAMCGRCAEGSKPSRDRTSCA